MAEGPTLQADKHTPRSCGECSLCCKTLTVDEIQKEAHTWCQYFSKGIGCVIYKSRPTVCRTFKCEWLKGNTPEYLNPRKTNAVLIRTTAVINKDDNTKSFVDALFVACDGDNTEAYKTGYLGKYVYECVRRGEPVYIVTKHGSKQLKIR